MEVKWFLFVVRKHSPNTKDYAFNLMFVLSTSTTEPGGIASMRHHHDDDKQSVTFFSIPTTFPSPKSPKFKSIVCVRALCSCDMATVCLLSWQRERSAGRVYLINSKCFSLLSFVMYLKSCIEDDKGLWRVVF